MDEIKKQIVGSMWLNNHTVIKSNLKKKKPCYKLGYCPYGQLVEAFELKEKNDEVSCDLFGHDCPMFYHAEDVSEGKKRELYEADMKKLEEKKE